MLGASVEKIARTALNIRQFNCVNNSLTILWPLHLLYNSAMAKTRIILVVLVLQLTSVFCVAQKVTISGQSISSFPSQNQLAQNFTAFSVFKVNVASVMERVDKVNTQVLFEFQLGSSNPWNFKMDRVEIKAKNYSIRVKTPEGIQNAAPTVIYTFQGQNESGKLAALTISNEMIYGFFEIGDDSWFIEPVWLFDPNAERDLFVVYRAVDVKPGDEVNCGVKEISKNPVPINPGNNKVVGSCLEAEVALASDYILFTILVSVSAVEARNIGVLNNVSVNYRHEFTDNIELILVEQFVDSVLPEEWTTSTDAGTLLSSFTSWGPTGFSATHDLATLWTGRDLDGTTVGLAWVDAVCSSYRYNICQYLGVSWEDRVVQAHEMGHNFSASHDASGSPYIMAPAINDTENWSSLSVSTINSSLPSYTCLATCTGSPVASFLADPVIVCSGGSVQFKDKSQNGFSRTWTFENGSPSSSTAQQPLVTYSTTGSHDVTIVSGSSTLLESNYITVDVPTTATCTTSGGTGGLTYFALANISNSTGTGSYTDYSCSDLTNLSTSTGYGISVTIYCPGGTEYKGIRFFIDYNNDGDLSDAGELVATSTYSWCGGVVTSADDPGLAFTTSSAPTTGQILRSRVIVNRPFPSSDPCQALTAGEAEDYGVYFASAPLPVELVEFRGEKVGEQVKLIWTTASEVNNSHFNIQRAILGELFGNIGKVPASKHPEQENHYEFVDEAPANDVNYYRLEQVDLDGTVEYSAVVAIKFDSRKPVSLSPNPTSGQFQILNTENAGLTEVLVYNTDGQLEIRTPFEGRPIDVSKLNPGMYMVELFGPKGTFHEKLIIR